MLKLHYGELEGTKYTGDGWFENQLGVEYLETNFSKSIVEKIDKSKVYDRNLIISPILGGIPPERLSGGTKTLICINYTDWVFSITAMGENCYEILAEIAEKKDVLLTCDRSMALYVYGFFGNIYVENTGKLVNNDIDLMEELSKASKMSDKEN